MRPWLPILVSLVLVSCEKDDTGMDYDILTGDLSFDDGAAVSVAGNKAFGFDRNGQALLYFAANPDATCDAVATYLDWGEPTDPSALFLANHCNVYAMINDFTGDDVTITSDRTLVTWALNCTMGAGSWNWEVQGDDPGYYWSESYWQGDPETWTITLSGGGGSDLVADISMNDYDGDYIYEFVEATASGLVTGTALVEWCEDLGETPLFSSR